MAKKNIAVLGAGMMGTGIAQLFASKGHKVMLIYVYDDKLRAKPVETMRGNLQVLVEQGVMEESQIQPIIDNVCFTESLEEAAPANFSIKPAPALPKGYAKVKILSEDKVCVYTTNGAKMTIPSVVAKSMGLVVPN